MEDPISVTIFLVVVVAVMLFLLRRAGHLKTPKEEKKLREKREEQQTLQKLSKIEQDSRIICPQCHEKGNVTTEHVKLKKGVSGGKVTGAILTVGISLLATGLSRKEKVTKAKCGNCGSVWHF